MEHQLGARYCFYHLESSKEKSITKSLHCSIETDSISQSIGLSQALIALKKMNVGHVLESEWEQGGRGQLDSLRR